jgi:hypothetical protein
MRMIRFIGLSRVAAFFRYLQCTLS